MSLGRVGGAGTGVVVFLWQKFEIVFFRLRASSWRPSTRARSVSELIGRVGGVARAPTRASKAEEEGGKA